MTEARLNNVLAMIKALHTIANPACDTLEDVAKARIVLGALKTALGEKSYADILSARATVEMMLEAK
jgi:hypothetical protein